MQAIPTPSARLCSALPYLTQGGAVIDVGTDHAYLPIYLVGQNISSRALACDINRGPIESAQRNIATAGLKDKIDTLCTDGLHGAEHFDADDIMIFGMGGELIIRILSEAPWVKNANIGLVLQPMTRAHLLRRWLLENGFAIVGETITHEDRYYQTIAARYCGKSEEYTEEELLLGRLNIQNNAPHLCGFVEHEIGVWEAIRRGKSRAVDADTRDEDRILQFLKARLETLK
ncbi:MAG: SAM-dependent methyltransferase [Clostridia bacterium]|nr:SAM-dependent methyltransferase [Clostridia bacterium]